MDRIALCDVESDRIAAFAERPDFQDKFHPRDAYDSLDAICKADLDALVIITQPWLHAPQALQALEAGKHVYSAVPIISIPDAEEILEWCDKIIEACRRTGRHYMLGETTYYHSQSMFCRRKAAEGAFGTYVYSEGEYIHPFDVPGCDLREITRRRMASKTGRDWGRLRREYAERGKRQSSMAYPTHSTSGPMCVMNAHALKVAAQGFRPRADDPDYLGWYEFSNVAALYEMSNGSTMRICEFREVAYPGGTIFHPETFRIFGTKGTFREDIWMVRDKATTMSVEEMRDPLPPEVAEAFRGDSGETVYGGHGGSHAYLVHEFVDAVAHDRVPAINAWEAARYMAAGCAAHQSALRDGEWLDVPDWGDAPA